MVLDQVEDLELDLPGDLVDDHPAVVADGGQRPGVGRRPRSRVHRLLSCQSVMFGKGAMHE